MSDPWSARQQRDLSAISEFTTTILHLSGKSNTVADALSRATISPLHASLPGVDYTEMATAQATDPEMSAYRTAVSDLVLGDISFGPTGKTLVCDVSTGEPRPVLPASMCRRGFDVAHGLSHPDGKGSLPCESAFTYVPGTSPEI